MYWVSWKWLLLYGLSFGSVIIMVRHITILLHLVVFQTVFAQYSWQVVHSDSVGPTSYVFKDVSCFGRFCTVIGYVYSPVNGYRIWNSDDWGKTWLMIDPLIPDSLRNRAFQSVSRVDSSHAFIVGSNGLFIASTDAGNTWEGKLLDGINLQFLHFSNRMSGIAIGDRGQVGTGILSELLTTSDGGAKWQQTSLGSPLKLRSCYSIGNGIFKVFNNPYGPIYSTEDNWQTKDSIVGIIDDTNDYSLAYCAFSPGDTIIAHGIHNTHDFPPNKGWRGLIMRTTTNGDSWERVSLKPSDSGGISQIWAVTAPNRDTIIAGGWSENKIAISFDAGNTWSFDTLSVPKRFGRTDVYKLLMMENGNVLGIYGDDRLNPRTVLFLGERTPSSVKTYTIEQQPVSVYPNPASESINIQIPSDASSLQIIDALGRTVKASPRVVAGTMKVDVSSLDPGLYHIVVGSDAGARSSAFIVAQ
jgi:photosystem II stability/assembly factor-like uncharacterized protein